jgi:hypothetical protein
MAYLSPEAVLFWSERPAAVGVWAGYGGLRGCWRAWLPAACPVLAGLAVDSRDPDAPGWCGARRPHACAIVGQGRLPTIYAPRLQAFGGLVALGWWPRSPPPGTHSAPSAPKMVNNFCLARRVARFNSYYASVVNLAARKAPKAPRARILLTSRAARLLGDTLLRLAAFRQYKKLTSVLVSPSTVYHIIGECSSTRKIHLYRSRASKKKNSKKKTFKAKLRYKGGRLQKKKVIPTLVYALANRQHTLLEKEARLRRFVRR